MGRDKRKRRPSRSRKFQFTRPHGARQPSRNTGTSRQGFQFTRPHGARPSSPWPVPVRRRFNSRARMGRDSRKHAVAKAVHVSIHAPAWGATGGDAARTPSPAFQFTRPHGARRRTMCVRRDGTGFNSRARMGRDFLAARVVVADFVSIHAPAWGATDKDAQKEFDKWFQFTRPHGARLLAAGNRASMQGVSIHAPAWGATIAKAPSAMPFKFQFTRPHGARHHQGRHLCRLCFNSRARMGRDFCRPAFESACTCFNSRARMGRDGSRGANGIK